MTADSTFCPSCGKPRQGSLRYCSSCGFDYASSEAPSKPTESATPVSAPVTTKSVHPASIAVIAGGLLIAIGSFLPWVTASTIFGSLSRSGIDAGGDGWITLVAGTVIAVLGLVTLTNPNRAANLLVAIGAAVAAVIFALDFSDVQGRVSDLESSSEGMALGGVGIGLWMVALGAIVSFIASLMRRSWLKDQTR